MTSITSKPTGKKKKLAHHRKGPSQQQQEIKDTHTEQELAQQDQYANNLNDDAFFEHMNQYEDYADTAFAIKSDSQKARKSNALHDLVVGQSFLNKKWQKLHLQQHQSAEGMLGLEQIELDDAEVEKLFGKPKKRVNEDDASDYKPLPKHLQYKMPVEERDDDNAAIIMEPASARRHSDDDDDNDDGEEEKRKQKKKNKKRKLAEMKKESKEAAKEQEEAEAKQNSENISMEDWSLYEGLLHSAVIENLKLLQFSTPTPVQRSTLDCLLENPKADLIAAAQTGSGKTLAFGMPVVSHLLRFQEKKGEETKKNRKMKALILTPTRELALQVTKHIKDVIKGTTLSISCIVGGISPEKQQRLLSYRPDILVATPGRYWDIAETGEVHLSELEELQFLVLDEADRMVAEGQFPEISKILEMINKYRKKMKKPLRLQKFVASATLTLEAKYREGAKKGRKHRGEQDSEHKGVISQLMNILELNEYKLVDLTPETHVAGTVQETQLQCPNDEKDMYLYYLLLRYPIKTIVFCNSISCVKHLQMLMEILQVKIYPLHGEMQQRQRLKNLDRFKADPKGILIATDVAARGIDVSDVKSVIHFQLARSTEFYVHRCGRSGRAQREGFSIALVSPEDRLTYYKICEATKKTDGIPMFPIENAYMKQVFERVKLARKIKVIRHDFKKHKNTAAWFVKQAEEMDIELDENFHRGVKQTAKEELENPDLEKMTSELKEMLAEKIVAANIATTKFITADTVDLYTAESNTDMRQAFQQDVAKSTTSKRAKKKRKLI